LGLNAADTISQTTRASDYTTKTFLPDTLTAITPLLQKYEVVTPLPYCTDNHILQIVPVPVKKISVFEGATATETPQYNIS
jgi:hypothetical protein